MCQAARKVTATTSTTVSSAFDVSRTARRPANDPWARAVFHNRPNWTYLERLVGIRQPTGSDLDRGLP